MEVEMKIRGLMMDPVSNMPIVILKDINGATVLPIWVGVFEANAIALEIVLSSTVCSGGSKSTAANWCLSNRPANGAGISRSSSKRWDGLATAR